MIEPKCMDMDGYFRTEDYTERVFEIEDALIVVSCRSGRTLLYEKKYTKILVYPLSHLFLIAQPTLGVARDVLIEEEKARPIII